jgi:hypothetical protein
MASIAGTDHWGIVIERRDGYPIEYFHWPYSFKESAKLQEAGVFRGPHGCILKQESVPHEDGCGAQAIEPYGRSVMISQ